jgi:hypothetical protein
MALDVVGLATGGEESGGAASSDGKRGRGEGGASSS